MQFIQARNFTPVTGQRVIDVIVMHTMEAREKPGTANAVARWFAGADAPRASAHYCIDAEEVISCVHENDVAWAAPGANKNGLQLEHAGFARQRPAEWADEYSQRMLARSARLCAQLCARYAIPVLRISASDLLARRRGICGHADVTQAFRKSTHTDPGGHFPWRQFLSLIAAQP